METAPESNPPSSAESAPSSRLWLAYVAPMAAFLALTGLEGATPRGWYVGLYLAKVGLVSLLLVVYRAAWRDIRPSGRAGLLGLLIGLAVFAEWVALDKIIPYPHLGSRTALDPFAALPSPGVRAAFLAARLFGLAVMVPVMEELFWRSFLLRYVTNPNWSALPIGTFSWGAFALVAGAFGLAHPEWLVAVICAVAYGLLLRQTRSLFACVIAHATTNLALGLYVLLTHDWRYW